MMLTRRRLRAHSALVASIAAVIVLLSAVLAGMIATVSGASIAAARQSLADAPPPEGAVRVAIRLAADARLAQEQDATVREVAREMLGGADAPVIITRDVIAPEVAVASAVSARTVAVVADPSFADGPAPAEGAWPAPSSAGGDPQVAVPAELASALGLAVGDRVELPGEGDAAVPFVVSGIVDEADTTGPEPADDAVPPSTSTRASGAPFPATPDGTAPVVIAEQSFSLLDTRPIARWTVAPDLAALSADDVERLAAGLPRLGAAIDEAPGARSQGVVIEGGLEDSLAGIRADARVAGAIVPIALILVAGAGVLATLELARSLAAARADEVSLLRSRGASPRQLIRAAAIDWMLVSAPSAVAGAAAGVLLAPAASGLARQSAAADAVLVAVVALAVAVATIVAGTATAARGALAPIRRESLGVERRERRALDAGALLLIVVLAAIALIAFRIAGGPVRLDDRGVVVEPVAVVAPALVLFAVALLGGAALRPLLQLLARSTQSRRGAGAALATTQLARRATAFAVPALLVAVAVGGGIVAGAYDASALAARDGARALALGGDVRVSAIDADAAAGALAALREAGRASGSGEAAASTAATPVIAATLIVAEDEVALVALDSRSIDAVVAADDRTVDRARLREVLMADEPPTIELPAAATAVRFAVGAVPAVPVEAAVWFMDAQGAPVRVAAEPAGDSAASDTNDSAASAAAGSTVVAPVPTGPAGSDDSARWRLAAIDVRPTALPVDGAVTIVVGAVTAAAPSTAESTAEPIAATTPWVPQPEATRSFTGAIASPSAEELAAAAATAGLDRGLAAVRIEATRLPDQPIRLMAAASLPPMAVTPALAERTALRVDDELRGATASVGRPVVGRVAGTVGAIPGTAVDEAIAVDLAAFTHHQLATTSTPSSPDQYWLAAPGDLSGGAVDGDRDGIAALLTELARAATGATVEAVAAPPDAPLLDAVRAALWAAAASVALLAIASVVAAAAASRRQRASEVVVLRALGRRPGLQGRDRAAELAVLLAASALIGLAAGAIVVAATVGGLAGATVLGAPAALERDVVVPTATAAAGAIVLLAVIASIAAVHGAAVARQARRLSAAEVLR